MAEYPMILEVSWDQFLFLLGKQVNVNWCQLSYKVMHAIIWGKKHAASQGNWLHVRMKIKIGWRTKVGREIR